MTFPNGNKMPHFAALEPETVKLHSPLGSMLDKVVKNRLVKIDYGQLAAPFRLRDETDNLWRCEFWGKWSSPTGLTIAKNGIPFK